MDAPVLNRETFTTSRMMEFFTRKELEMQIGHDESAWPIALVKELIDNSLDACEKAGIAPVITVDVGQDYVTVTDNGPGLPENVLAQSLDYSIRVSDKNGYVAPTRGQLGNALKCVWAAPFVISTQKSAVVEVGTANYTAKLCISLDRIAQQPIINLVKSDPFVKSGTFVKMCWPLIASYLSGEKSRYFYKAVSVSSVLDLYAFFNPHATFMLTKNGGEPHLWQQTGNFEKWTPQDPTSPHWYDVQQLRNLVAAYVNHDRQIGRRTTVREFVSTFRGLSGSAKQKKVTSSAALPAYLDDLTLNGDIDLVPLAALLKAMQDESKPVKPEIMGVIGKEHFEKTLKRFYLQDESFAYRVKMGSVDNRPYVLEVAFGILPEGASSARVTVGLNWTTTLSNPIRTVWSDLSENRIDSDDPILLLIHLAYPALSFTDRGKGTVALPKEIENELTEMIGVVTKLWKKLKNDNAKQERLQQRQIKDELDRQKAKPMSITDACKLVVEQAYLHASSNGTYPANARQVMYAARPLVLAMCGSFFKNSSSFTQEFLPDFIRDNPELTAIWDIVYDDRGHLAEPHTRVKLGLGTIAVRNYIGSWNEGRTEMPLQPVSPARFSSNGPENRYKYVLFIEKEGFNPLLERALIADKYDIAIESTKGQTVTAARTLAEAYSKAGVTILVLHDFDKSGFEIVNAYRSDTRRYQYGQKPLIIDIGLRLADAKKMDLQSEPVSYRTGIDPKVNLGRSGATKEERNFLVRAGNARDGWEGERVELNAMTSKQFLDFLEEKFEEVGVTKTLPDEETAQNFYRTAYQMSLIAAAVSDFVKEVKKMKIDCPNDLLEQIEKKIDGTTESWDSATSLLASSQAFKDMRTTHKNTG